MRIHKPVLTDAMEHLKRNFKVMKHIFEHCKMVCILEKLETKMKYVLIFARNKSFCIKVVEKGQEVN